MFGYIRGPKTYSFLQITARIFPRGSKDPVRKSTLGQHGWGLRPTVSHLSRGRVKEDFLPACYNELLWQWTLSWQDAKSTRNTKVERLECTWFFFPSTTVNHFLNKKKKKFTLITINISKSTNGCAKFFVTVLNEFHSVFRAQRTTRRVSLMINAWIIVIPRVLSFIFHCRGRVLSQQHYR